MNSGVQSHLQYAGFSDRAAAFVIDMIIVSTLWFYLLEPIVDAGRLIGLFFSGGTASALDEPSVPVILGIAVAAVVVLILLSWLYSAGLTCTRQFSGTFGKVIMGMKVVDVTGEQVSFGRATVRFIAKVFSALIVFIGFFMIHFSPEKQGLHDRFAGTYVVYSRKDGVVPAGAGPTVAAALRKLAEKKEAESRANVKKGLFLIILPIIIIAVLLTAVLVFAAMVWTASPAGFHIQEHRVVAVTVEQVDDTTLVLTYQGGAEGDVLALERFEIVMNDGPPAAWTSPVMGDRMEFHEGTIGPDHVVVTAIFRDGSRKVVLDTRI